MNKQKKLLLALLVGLLSVVLAACGFGGEDKKDDAKKTDDKGAETTKDSGDNTLRLVTTSEPPSLNPQLATDSTSSSILTNVFEGLTRLDKDAKPEEAMAEKIEVSDDQLTYTFTLRDAKWSNGDTVTAGDFKYAWLFALDPENASEYASILYPIKNAEAFNAAGGKAEDVGIEVKDDKTLVVNLEHPVPYFLELTAFYTYMPVNEKVATANPKWHANADENYVTNGPFTLASWEHDTSITLEKYADYWDAANVALDAVSIEMVEKEDVVATKFKSNEIDFIGAPFQTVALNSIDEFKAEGILNVKEYASIYNYKMNTEGEFTKNANIRKALALAIDRQKLIDEVTKGEQTPALGMVPKAIKGFEEDRGYFKDNDIEGAKAALEAGMTELGIKDPKDITIKLSYNTSEGHAAIAQYVQEGWAKNLGINVKLDNSEWQVYLEKINQQDYEVGRMGWVADYNDAYTFLEMYNTADNGNNDTGWENAEYKKLIADSNLETDPEKRLDMLKAAEKIGMTEFPIAPVYYYTNLSVAKPYVKNMDVDPIGNIQLKHVSLEEK